MNIRTENREALPRSALPGPDSGAMIHRLDGGPG